MGRFWLIAFGGQELSLPGILSSHSGIIIPPATTSPSTRRRLPLCACQSEQTCFRIPASSKQKVLARSCDQARTNWGMGVRHALFPVLTLGAKLAASFPTLFSTASGVSGLVAGPSWAFQPQDYRVRPLSSLRLALAGAGLRTRLRHVCNRSSAS